jgi:hypothetical protein
LTRQETRRFLGGSISGSIDGGSGGVNTLDYSGSPGGVSVNLASHSASLVGSFAHINSLVGSATSLRTLLPMSRSLIAGGPSSSGPIRVIPIPSNTLYSPGSSSTIWDITGTNAGLVGMPSEEGRLANAVQFVGFQNLVAGHGADRFAFSDGAGVSGSIHGNPLRFHGMVIGGTYDVTLDYSAYTTGVFVDLRTGQATGVGGGVAYISSVIGGQGDDILVGDGWGTTLRAGSGRDLIISGGGAACLYSGTGASSQAILVSGSTRWDADAQKLKSIEAVWADTGRSYQQRTDSLFKKYLNASTVYDDGASASLTGRKAGMDWFECFSTDAIYFWMKGERVDRFCS